MALLQATYHREVQTSGTLNPRWVELQFRPQAQAQRTIDDVAGGEGAKGPDFP